MSDLSSALNATMHDPLVIVLALFALGMLATRLLFRKYPVRRAIVRVVFLILLTVALLHADIVPYQPSGTTGTPARDVVHAILKAAWWIWGAWFLVGVLRASLIVEARPHEGRLLQDLIAGFIYLAALFAIVSYVLNQPIQGLLATSGVIAIILGLALQSTLGDVFSGIVLNFTRPYRPGDWISIEGGTDGRVIEINWRATHILTAKRDLAIVPNSTIAKSKITNVSSPSGIHGVTITVLVGTRFSPAMVAEILKRALLNCRLVLTIPAPSVAVKAMNAVSVDFEIAFFVAELGLATQAQNELLDLIHRHLASEGVTMAVPADQSHAASVEPTPALRSRREQLLDRVSLFTSLCPEERGDIAKKLTRFSFEEGDVLLESGTVVQSLYIIAIGVLSFVRDDGASESELLRPGPGDHFGEIGLLTGTATAVRIVALTAGLAYQLAQGDVVELMQTHPDVSRALNRTVTSRQTVLAPPAATELDHPLPTRRLKGWLAHWLQRRYDLAVANE